MISKCALSVTSVTSDPLFFLDDTIAQLLECSTLIPPAPQGTFWEAMGQSRLDKSASNLAVRKLLETAAAGGMCQKDFEMSAVFLRPGRKNDIDSKINRSKGFNGTLWHDYMNCESEVRMSLLAFNEYTQYFFSKGWLQSIERKTLLGYSVEKIDSLAAVKKMFPPSWTAESEWLLERTARTYRSKRC